MDLFAGTFDGLCDRLDHIASLGASCVWLLPRVGPRGILNAEREASCGVADRETL